jgi:hypothetical protein
MACEREAWIGVCSLSLNGEWMMPMGCMLISIIIPYFVL